MGSTADYWVGTTIAEGAFGTVVYGQHKLSRLPVAIKCVPKAVMAKQPVTAIQLVQEQKILKRLNELQQQQQQQQEQHSTSREKEDGTSDTVTTTNSTASSLSSPFVKLYASFHDAHCVYLVTELCCGGTLQDAIASHVGKTVTIVGGDNHGTCGNSSGTTSSSNLWREHYGLQILEALSALHDVKPAGIVHCDLKPHNVLLTHDGRVKLADFGSAIVRGDPAIVSSPNNNNNIPRGSPGYAAPEVMTTTDHNNITVAADLWSLGCVLFALWNGESPFEDSGSAALTVQRSRDYCTLPDETARMAFLFLGDTKNNNVKSGADEEEIGTSRKFNQVPSDWKMLISTLLRQKPCERAGMSDQDLRTKDGKVYPSLHQSKVWRDVDTSKNPGLLPVVPQWWIEQQNAEKNDNDGLKDGAIGWTSFLI